MAPPKPTTPDAIAKKKVTPAQVAFLIERYLADSGFHAALAAFRSDAAHLFSPHRAKLPPKGLPSLVGLPIPSGGSGGELGERSALRPGLRQNLRWRRASTRYAGASPSLPLVGNPAPQPLRFLSESDPIASNAY
jgi:hypothetical protein